MLSTSDLRNKIILELLFSNLVHFEEGIDYEKFELLYSNYHYLPESYFASILGIGIVNFYGLKMGYHNAIILKNMNHSLKNQLIEKLLKSGIVYYNQKITYRQFLAILDIIPFLSENVLADLLGITTSRLQNLRYKESPTATFTILKKHDISEKEELIIQHLIDCKIIY